MSVLEDTIVGTVVGTVVVFVLTDSAKRHEFYKFLGECEEGVKKLVEFIKGLISK